MPSSVLSLLRSLPRSSATPAALHVCLAIGLLAAIALPLTATGAAWTVVAVLILVAAWRWRQTDSSRFQLAFAVLAALLVTVPAYRSAPWLAVLCLPSAAGLATLSLLPARTWTGTVLGAVSGGLLALPAGLWLLPALGRSRPSARRAAVAGATGLLTLVFGGLFLTADSAYAAVVENALPLPDLTSLPGRLLVLLVVTAGASTALYLAQSAPSFDLLAPGPGRQVRRWEWAIPLVCLDLLFLSFVTVQVAVLFGGRRHVLNTQDLTYAEYARQGFWQLLVVTALTLAVVALVARYAPRESQADRTAVRVLLGALCLLSLVVVASAFKRMSVYQDEYGFTRLRLLVDVVELALGAVFVLVLASGIRLRAGWLPRATVVTGAVALLGLAAINPDAYIARHNIERQASTGTIDLGYLAGLSADATDELLQLPEAQRDCALARVQRDLAAHPDPWFNTNLGRAQARDRLRALQLSC